MKPYTLIAVILIILGGIALAYQGITYKTREKAFEIGSLQVTTEEKHTIPMSPLFGFLAVGGGVLMLLLRNKTPARG